jgi:hypothetical protein
VQEKHTIYFKVGYLVVEIVAGINGASDSGGIGIF